MTTLRYATMEDADLLRRCRPELEVTPEAHADWMSRTMTRDKLFVAELGGVAIGTGRISDWPNAALPQSCEIHYALLPGWRHQGHGVALVRALVARAKELGYVTVGAHIRRDNRPSLLCAINGGVHSVELL